MNCVGNTDRERGGPVQYKVNVSQVQGPIAKNRSTTSSHCQLFVQTNLEYENSPNCTAVSNI